MAFLRVAAVSSRVRVNFSAVESKVFCKTFSAQPISRSIHMPTLGKEWVNIKSRVLPETCSLYQISSGQGGQWSFCHDLMRSFYSMNVEPGRKGQGSRCWRCWTRPLGSRCPRSCLSSSPAQDIVQKWDIEAVSRRLLARSHLNAFAPRYTAPVFFLQPGYFAGFRFSARCSVALPAGRKSLPSSFTKRRNTKLLKFRKGQKN